MVGGGGGGGASASLEALGRLELGESSAALPRFDTLCIFFTLLVWDLAEEVFLDFAGMLSCMRFGLWIVIEVFFEPIID